MPTQILRHAVIGMLPKNRLRKTILKKLRIFPDEFHIYEEQLQGKPSIIEPPTRVDEDETTTKS